MSSGKSTYRAFAFAVSFVFILSSMLIGPTMLFHRNPTNSNVLPKGNLIEVPVTVANLQQTPTSNPFNQEIVVDSHNYQQYEASNLQNVFWMTQNYTIIPSWIESGNNNSSNHTVYWLRLPFTIGANSIATIYICFAKPNVSLFSRYGNEGEWPLATNIYGQYDNGANVFLLYDDFAGNALNLDKWSVIYNDPGASYSINDGLTLNGNPPNEYVNVITKQMYSGIYEAYLESTGTNSWAGSGMFISNVLPTSTGGYWGFHTGYMFFVTDNRPGSGFGSYIALEVNVSEKNLVYTSAQITRDYLMTVYWQTGNETWGDNLTPLVTSHDSTLPQGPAYMDLWIGGDETNSESSTYQYARIVSYMPNNTMPSYQFGIPFTVVQTSIHAGLVQNNVS